eukprot:6463753-Amphidinium_carterae.1
MLLHLTVVSHASFETLSSDSQHFLFIWGVLTSMVGLLLSGRMARSTAIALQTTIKMFGWQGAMA